MVVIFFLLSAFWGWFYFILFLFLFFIFFIFGGLEGVIVFSMFSSTLHPFSCMVLYVCMYMYVYVYIYVYICTVNLAYNVLG